MISHTIYNFLYLALDTRTGGPLPASAVFGKKIFKKSGVGKNTGTKEVSYGFYITKHLGVILHTTSITLYVIVYTGFY